MARDEPPDSIKRIPDLAVLEAQALAEPAGPLDDGQLEAQSLSRGLKPRDLKKEAEEADHDRSELFKTHFEIMAIITLWVLFLVFLGFGLIWALHVAWPQSGWLGRDQLDDITGLLTGGVIAGLVADHVRRRMG